MCMCLCVCVCVQHLMILYISTFSQPHKMLPQVAMCNWFPVSSHLMALLQTCTLCSVRLLYTAETVLQ